MKIIKHIAAALFVFTLGCSAATYLASYLLSVTIGTLGTNEWIVQNAPLPWVGVPLGLFLLMGYFSFVQVKFGRILSKNKDREREESLQEGGDPRPLL